MVCRLEKGFREGSAGQKSMLAAGLPFKVPLLYNCYVKTNGVSSLFCVFLLKKTVVLQTFMANTQKTAFVSTLLSESAIKHMVVQRV